MNDFFKRVLFSLPYSFFYGFSALGAFCIAPSLQANDDEHPPLLMDVSTQMLANTCMGCHGPDGISSGPATPTISGMSVDVFIQQMEGYKDNTIPSVIMSRIAQGYTAKEIKAMAELFAKKKFVAAKGQQSDAALAKKGAKLHKKYCENCHSEGGTSAEDDAGILSGRWKPYLQMSLEDYMKGERQATKKMSKKLNKLLKKEGKEGIKALIEFYAK